MIEGPLFTQALLLLISILACYYIAKGYILNIIYIFSPSTEGFITTIIRITGVFIPFLGVALGFFKPTKE